MLEKTPIQLVIRQIGSQVHILVPWHDVHGASTGLDPVCGTAGLENAPSVFLPIYRG